VNGSRWPTPIPQEWRAIPYGPTVDDALAILTVITALGCALNAGVFFAFSSFVMNALARLPAAEGAGSSRAARSISWARSA
jgi:hypothetical protein